MSGAASRTSGSALGQAREERIFRNDPEAVTQRLKPRRPWKTLPKVELATAEWVDWFNHRRLHGEIGHVPPAEYEAAYYQQNANPHP